ncbi:MAG: AraC family transcriptional regulator [Verrucomicrobiae bacterium]|nr:AraC family transcriptional regulator [Verrucomicrobiae bacterium]
MSAHSPTDALTLRDRFLRAIPPERHFHRLFDHLPGILFFAKDTEGRLLAANRALLRLYGYQREEEFWGVTDFELLPRSLAEKFRQDDLKVIETGEPMLQIVELFMNPQGIPGWFLTNKLPVFAITGDVIGVMGTIQNYDEIQREIESPDAGLSPALKLIGSHFNREISIPELAERCDLSVRQFERKFKQHLKTTPQQFIIKTRVYAACDDLRRTRKSLASIATSMGFYDQAAFTRLFRKHMGMTPMQYRRQFR